MNIVQRWRATKDSMGCELYRVTMLIRDAVAEIKAECGQNVYFRDVTVMLGLVTCGYGLDVAGLPSFGVSFRGPATSEERLEAARESAVATHCGFPLADADEWVGKMASWTPEYIRHIAESLLI